MNSLYTLWILLSGNPCNKRTYKLLKAYDTPELAFRATQGGLDRTYFDEKDIEAFSDHSLDKAEKLLEHCEKSNIDIITYYDNNYPDLLRHIDIPPLALFIKGKLPDTSVNPAITIIGTRECSDSGKKISAKFAYELSKAGLTVISGMARGIDTYAHKGCLMAQSPTIAVLAGGVDVVYPKENQRLYEIITEHGAVISEMLPGKGCEKWAFRFRNRILSGLSQATLVVESSDHGGSLITVGHALEQNKTVFAIPGSLGAEESKGTNKLIRDGAILCSCPADILEEYKLIFGDRIKIETDSEKVLQKKDTALKKADKSYNIKCSLSDEELSVYRSFDGKTLPADNVCQKTGLQFSHIILLLSQLELKGCIEQLPGGLYKPKQI